MLVNELKSSSPVKKGNHKSYKNVLNPNIKPIHFNNKPFLELEVGTVATPIAQIKPPPWGKRKSRKLVSRKPIPLHVPLTAATVLLIISCVCFIFAAPFNLFCSPSRTCLRSSIIPSKVRKTLVGWNENLISVWRDKSSRASLNPMLRVKS